MDDKKYEKIVEHTISRSVNIAANKVESLRVSEDLKTVIRVYDGEKVGIAGAIGICDENSLLEQAESKLVQGIPYPDISGSSTVREEVNEVCPIDGNEIVEISRSLVEKLCASYPYFIFSNKINTEQYCEEYENSLDVRYKYQGANVQIGLAIKAKSSANIMDLLYSAVRGSYSEEQVVSDIGALLDVYGNKLEIPEDVPVLIPSDIIELLIPHLVAEKYMAGSSLFNGRLGERIFSDKVNLVVSRKPDNEYNIPFFDREGTVVEGDEFPLINNGTLSGLITYRRSAENLNLPLSGSAAADFDSVPSAGSEGIKLLTSDNSLKELVRGKAIYISVTSGGDMTPAGDFGLPVLLAYVYEDGKLLGTLPEFSLSGNVFDVLGGDLIGIDKNDVFSFADETLIVSKFKINK